MTSAADWLVEQETRFWESLVTGRTDAAVDMLTEPSFMVGPHGPMRFDHATYRRMAEQGSMVVKRYQLGRIDVTFVADGAAVLSYEVTQVIARRGQDEEIEQRMNDTSTWVKVGDDWRCAMHTETPATASSAR